jgi:hypothetical protein
MPAANRQRLLVLLSQLLERQLPQRAAQHAPLAEVSEASDDCDADAR